MFERYTEGARRAVFFALYEAKSLGCTNIDTEHLLLGILRDDKTLVRQVLLKLDYESAHREIAGRSDISKSKPTASADLPLSNDTKLAIAYGAEEAERLNSNRIGTEHLLLGLLRDKEFASAKLLAQSGTDLESLRKRVGALPGKDLANEFMTQYRRVHMPPPSTVEIHGKKRNVDEVRSVVVRLKSHNYYWERKLWQMRDVVYEKDGKRFSFDTSLANDQSKFILVKAGWKKDYCAVCLWELLETDDATHGTGYTNGKDWICQECHGRFVAGDYFASAYSDIT